MLERRHTPRRRKIDVPAGVVDVIREELKIHGEAIDKKMDKKLQEFAEGPIKDLDNKLTAQNKAIQPAIDLVDNLHWGGKIVMGGIGFLASIGGLWLLGRNLFSRT